MKYLLLLLMIALAPASHAVDANLSDQDIPLSETQPNIYEFFNGVIGKTVSVHVYTEQGLWIVDENVIAEDGLPDHLNTSTFRSKRQAYDYIQSLGATEQNKFDEALNMPPEEADLDVLEGLTPTTPIWTAENTWSWDWEIKKANWVRTFLHPAFFQELGIENDCADAMIQTHLIFARLYKLPVSIHLAASGAWFTNATMRTDWKKLKTVKDWTLPTFKEDGSYNAEDRRWIDDLKKDKQFLEVLDWVAENAYTHTLGQDVYPVKLTKEGLIEGSAFLYLHEVSGHTLIVNEINLNNLNEDNKARLPMYTLNSTVPKGVQPLTESFFVNGEQPVKEPYGYNGFVRFRWPVSAGAKEQVAVEDMPYYSMEQYDPNLMSSDETLPEDDPARTNFSLFVFKRLNPDFDPVQRITEGIQLIKDNLASRVDVVEKGYVACKAGCAADSQLYDDWSTPSRDKRLKELIGDMESYQSALYSIPTVVQAWNDALKSNVLKLNGADYPLSLVKWVWQNDLFSSDPNKLPGLRWGIEPEFFAQASYEEILPALQARQEKIQQNGVCVDCPLFSAEYMLSSTYVEDTDIGNAIYLRSQYCLNAGDELCKRFEDKMKSLPTIVPTQPNFWETWNNIALFNSDPRVPLEARWGAITAFDDYLRLEGSWSIDQDPSQDGLLLAYAYNYPSSKLSVIDINAKKSLFTNTYPSTVYWSMNKETSELLGRTDDNKAFLVNPKTGEQTSSLKVPQMAAEESIYTSNWNGPDSLVMTTGSRLMVFERTEGVWQQTQEMAGYFSVYDAKIAVAVDVQGLTYYNLNTHESALIPFKNMFGGVTPNSIYADRSSDNTISVDWNWYPEEGEGKSGRIWVNLSEKTAKAVDMNLWPNRPYNGIAYNLNADSTKTTLYFLDDNLNVLNTQTFDGSCGSCYSIEKYVQIGATVYEVDRPNSRLNKVVELSSGFTMSSIFDNFMLADAYEPVTYASSSALIDLTNGKVVAMAPYLSLTTYMDTMKSVYPFISATYSITKTTDAGTDQEQSQYYTFYSTIDPLNVAVGSVLTTPAYYGGDGCEECGPEFEGDREMMAGLLPINLGEEDYKNLKLQTPTVKVISPVPATERQRPLRILTVADKMTLLIFNK